MTDSTFTPHFVVAGGDAATTFYEKALAVAAKKRHVAKDGSRIMHAHLVFGAGGIFLNDEFQETEVHGTVIKPDQLGEVIVFFILTYPMRVWSVNEPPQPAPKSLWRLGAGTGACATDRSETSLGEYG